MTTNSGGVASATEEWELARRVLLLGLNVKRLTGMGLTGHGGQAEQLAGGKRPRDTCWLLLVVFQVESYEIFLHPSLTENLVVAGKLGNKNATKSPLQRKTKIQGTYWHWTKERCGSTAVME